MYFFFWVDTPDFGPQFLFYLNILLVVNPDKSKEIPVFDTERKHSVYWVPHVYFVG